MMEAMIQRLPSISLIHWPALRCSMTGNSTDANRSRVLSWSSVLVGVLASDVVLLGVQ
jgi:hypothetical protein